MIRWPGNWYPSIPTPQAPIAPTPTPPRPARTPADTDWWNHMTNRIRTRLGLN